MTRLLQFLCDVTAGIDAVNMGRAMAFRGFMSGTEQAPIVSSHKSIVRGD